ncbi:MAG: segregation/condensation protein A [Oscillospiraceae bacterium]|nr:segregation/condensation protein A [Oscillospiraceae bacterium]
MDDKLSFKLQTFEGPLDLLLHLIKKNKVSVYDIPIVEITNQYLEYLDKMEQFDLEISSEFLYMASELLYIKSKMLLPKHDEDEEDPRRDLADRLVEYEKIKKAKEKLEKMQYQGYLSFYKPPTLPEKENKPKRIEHIDIEKLTEAFMTVIEKTERKMPPPKEKFEGIVAHVTISVEDKTAYYLSRIKKGESVSFFKMFENVESRSEAVSAFLAILELMRSGVFEAYDKDGEIYIERTKIDINTEEIDNNYL